MPPSCQEKQIPPPCDGLGKTSFRRRAEQSGGICFWLQHLRGSKLLEVGTLVFLLSLFPVQARATVQAASLRESDQALADEGMSCLMNGEADAAISLFREISKQDPASPLGDLLQADATWWKIYYTTANLVDPDVFDVVYSDTTPYDSQFDSLIQTAISKAEARIAARQDVAENYLYDGMSYALKGRLDGLRARDLATARDGKKMRSLLLTALQLDPNLTDAYAGIGLYNYFVATLPTIVKMLRFLIGLPGGSRRLGLQQLTEAAERGNLVRAEAKFYLAKDYTRSNEMQFDKSLQLFDELQREYPHNPFWKLMVASVHMRLGHEKEGDALYRQVLAETAGRNTLVDESVHEQVAKALERLHPGESIH